eukprot:354352-Chlamydomonas_euryale.AAC.6
MSKLAFAAWRGGGGRRRRHYVGAVRERGRARAGRSEPRASRAAPPELDWPRGAFERSGQETIQSVVSSRGVAATRPPSRQPGGTSATRTQSDRRRSHSRPAGWIGHVKSLACELGVRAQLIKCVVILHVNLEHAPEDIRQSDRRQYARIPGSAPHTFATRRTACTSIAMLARVRDQHMAGHAGARRSACIWARSAIARSGTTAGRPGLCRPAEGSLALSTNVPSRKRAPAPAPLRRPRLRGGHAQAAGNTGARPNSRCARELQLY